MKARLLYAGIFVGLFLLSWCAKKENQEIKIIDPAVVIQSDLSTEEAEKVSPSLSSCAEERKCNEGFFCYDSQYSGMWPNGVVQGPQEGDLLCHKFCENNSDCWDWKCREEVEIRMWDLVEKKSFCD